MAAKSFWQSMTGWVGKSADPVQSGQPRVQADPRQREATPNAAASPPLNSVSTEPEQRSLDFTNPVASGSAEPAPPAQASGPGGETQQQAGSASPPESGDENQEIENRIIEIIKTCYDPEIPVNIYELGLIYGVKVDPPDHAHITMTLTAPNCPAAQSLPAEVKFKVEAMDEIKSADVEIVFDPPWTPQHMSDSAKLALNLL